METIIKKAIRGGWNESSKYKLIDVYGGCLTFSFEDMDGIKSSVDWQINEIVLDPLFWQALTKMTHPHTKRVWINTAMCFYQINLNEGWDKAVEYLKEITN